MKITLCFTLCSSDWWCWCSEVLPVLYHCCS